MPNNNALMHYGIYYQIFIIDLFLKTLCCVPAGINR